MKLQVPLRIADEVLDLVGRQRDAQGLDDRDPAAPRSPRRPRPGRPRAPGRRSPARARPAGPCSPSRRACPRPGSPARSESGGSDAPHHLDDDVDLRVVDDPRGSVVTRTPSSSTPRGRSGSRTAAHFHRICFPARLAMRSPCSVRSRATPVPTVPSPDQPHRDLFHVHRRTSRTPW